MVQLLLFLFGCCFICNGSKKARAFPVERTPWLFMLQQARLVELPALSAIPHIHAGLPRC